MAINRYDSPAEAQFIDTYVPIPFEKLYTLGKQAKEEVDKKTEVKKTKPASTKNESKEKVVEKERYYDPDCEEMVNNTQ